MILQRLLGALALGDLAFKRNGALLYALLKRVMRRSERVLCSLTLGDLV